MMIIPRPEERREVVQRLEELSAQPVMLCLQCGKCTSGCPFASDMDLMPHQMVHLAQMGMLQELISCEGIWYCATCFTCESRCPVEIDIAALAEAVRNIFLLDGGEGYGPDQISKEDAQRAPQQALVSLYRKFAN